MAKLPDLVARIRLDTSALDRATGQVNASTTGMSKGFGRLGVAAKVGMGIAAVAIAKFGKDALKSASESRKVVAQTEARLKASGGAAKVSAKHIGDLAASLQKLSGVQDESIQTGQNLLLTFSNIRNEAGRGNDIFDRATRTMLDMSVALGVDASSAATQLGKALHDPAKGAAALSKAGSLAKADLEKLKEMAKAGVPVLEQQKFILEALATQYGGAAAAAGAARTPMEKLKLVFEDMQEAIGERLLVVLDRLSAWFNENGPFIRDWLSLMGERVQFLGIWFGLMGEKVAGWGAALYNAAQVMVGVAESIGKFFQDIYKGAMKAAGAIGNLVSKINSIPGAGVAKKVGEFIGKGWLKGKIPGFEHGGVVPGPIGSPQLAVVHGGETVIPNGPRGTSKGNVTINQNLRTDARPDDIGRAVAWALR